VGGIRTSELCETGLARFRHVQASSDTPGHVQTRLGMFRHVQTRSGMFRQRLRKKAEKEVLQIHDTMIKIAKGCMRFGSIIELFEIESWANT
jgi:hypothetical protein